jgi:FkbM family methyltransferase
MLRSLAKKAAVRFAPRLWVKHVLAHDPGEKELKLLSCIVPRDRAAIDIGANIGAYTRALALLTPTVHAFEPAKDAARLLKASSAANVRVYDCALSDHNGEAVLNVPRSGAGRITTRASLNALNSGHETDRVQVRTLDSFSFLHVGFIKIDVEGHELSVVRGGLSTIDRCRPALLIECEERHNPGGLASVRKIFEAMGYRGRFFNEDTLSDIDQFAPELHQADPQTSGYVNNFFFLPGR